MTNLTDRENNIDDPDYVIVGAGTAGCVLAARLTERGARVLVLEAGGADVPPAMSDPRLWPTLQNTDYDWAFSSTPQVGAAGDVLPVARGRGLGGSSSINGMYHLRGIRADFAAWTRSGARGWTYDDLLPYFMRSERVANGDPAYRGDKGPMIIAPQPESNPFWQVVRDAVLEAGYAAVGDLNAPEAEGVGWLDVNVAGGVRQSAADAYLRPALDRPGLTVATGAFVTGLIVRGGHCAGVRYTVDGREQTAYASAEVILTAGVIGSPQLLQLSGIGPADHLRSLGIQVACDLPGVGENLQDHPQTGVAYITTRPARHATYARKPAVVLRSGPGRKTADLQFIFIDRPIVPRGRPLSDDGYTLAVSLMTPDSRGRVRLRSPDPAAAPSIDLGLLTAAGDVERLVAGLRLARVIGEARALDDWRKAERAPGPAVTNDTGLADYVRHSATSYFHAAGTCRMGEDNGAVVDSLLRVRGVTGLRVADASVMPTVVSANTNATVLAVAERAADLILAPS